MQYWSWRSRVQIRMWNKFCDSIINILAQKLNNSIFRSSFDSHRKTVFLVMNLFHVQQYCYIQHPVVLNSSTMFHSMPKAQKLLEYNQFKLQIENTHDLVSYRFPVIFGGIHLARTHGWKCTYQFPAIFAGIQLTRADGWKYTWPRLISISCNVRRNSFDSERKGSFTLPKRMNFRKSSKRPLAPPPPLIFRKLCCKFFPKFMTEVSSIMAKICNINFWIFPENWSILEVRGFPKCALWCCDVPLDGINMGTALHFQLRVSSNMWAGKFTVFLVD